MTSPTHYQILSLPQSPPPTPQSLKKSYRLALLSNHPDKTKSSISPSTKKPKYTIDQISLAYATLSSPQLKQAYDKYLLLTQNNNNSNSTELPKFQTGIEIIDLDDLDYDDSRNQWYRSCRCGNPRGYLFGEEDLEDAADLGELMVGCADCSLWLRVHFAVVEEEEDENKKKQHQETVMC
ncbi:Diphthamide biosynthesis protein 4 [Podospora fimiseda]|uniref:Diphthamide biosynthesis protein 4 n=1 Tax=Podospora fimiseda TaxID=252190 RepID=A0AAN7BVW2_9PEZI|nr:Diphthamide biosynthesis protein 4 [Podospora fimiseda]